jgi:hypothetical protein
LEDYRPAEQIQEDENRVFIEQSGKNQLDFVDHQNQ